MISFIPEVEYVANQTKKEFIPLDKQKVNKAHKNLKLKRKQPIKNRNTLEQCMNLKYI